MTRSFAHPCTLIYRFQKASSEEDLPWLTISNTPSKQRAISKSLRTPPSSPAVSERANVAEALCQFSTQAGSMGAGSSSM